MKVGGRGKNSPTYTPILLFFLAFTLLAAPAHAQVAEAVRAFDDGNRAYTEGAYRDALDAYQRALDSGYASGALYTNMGNAYFRLDELGQAIRYYEKARLLTPDDPRLLHNLEIARSRIETSFSSLPTLVWIRWWRRFILPIGAWPFFVAGLVGYAIGVVLLGQRIWTGTRNPWHRRALAVSLLGGLLLLATAFAASLDRTFDQQAVVVTTVASLHQSPNASAPSDADIPEGIVVDVLNHRDTWIEVRLPNGRTGWLRTDEAAEI